MLCISWCTDPEHTAPLEFWLPTFHLKAARIPPPPTAQRVPIQATQAVSRHPPPPSIHPSDPLIYSSPRRIFSDFPCFFRVSICHFRFLPLSMSIHIYRFTVLLNAVLAQHLTPVCIFLLPIISRGGHKIVKALYSSASTLNASCGALAFLFFILLNASALVAL
jgi:hypothetical protein